MEENLFLPMICTSCQLKGISGMQFRCKFELATSQAACLAHEGNQLKHVHLQPRIAARQYGDRNEFYKLATNSKIYFTILIFS